MRKAKKSQVIINIIELSDDADEKLFFISKQLDKCRY